MNQNRDIKSAKEREAMAAWLIEHSTGARVSMMPNEYCPFDYLISRPINGNHLVTSMAEYRGRPDTKRLQYPTVMINVKKVNDMRAAAELLGIERMIYIVQWLDTDPMWISLNRDLGEEDQFTRNEEERPTDHTEPVYHLDPRNFRPF